jgi:hypothetical protein
MRIGVKHHHLMSDRRELLRHREHAQINPSSAG